MTLVNGKIVKEHINLKPDTNIQDYLKMEKSLKEFQNIPEVQNMLVNF